MARQYVDLAITFEPTINATTFAGCVSDVMTKPPTGRLMAVRLAVPGDARFGTRNAIEID